MHAEGIQGFSTFKLCVNSLLHEENTPRGARIDALGALLLLDLA